MLEKSFALYHIGSTDNFKEHQYISGFSAFGAVTFSKRVVSPFMFKNLSKLKSGKECDGFITLVSGADFRRDDRYFIGF